MLKIDEKLLLSDLLLTVKQLHMHPDSNLLKCDYNRFIELNEICAQNFYKMVDPNGVVIDTQKTQRIIDKSDNLGLYKFCYTIDSNNKLIYDIFSSYSKILEDINFYPIRYYDVIRKYSEKDYIDLILSYFATFGDKIYNIVKKYFDEKRIHMGQPYDGNYAAFFMDLLWLNSGYIFSSFNYYDSMSASSLVHELGHAIDAEMFIFPQQEDSNIYFDHLCEVPSVTFELGFIDYLKESKIDIDGSMILNNDMVLELSEFASDLKELFLDLDCEMFPNGVARDNNGKDYDVRKDILYGMGYYFAMHLNLIRKSNINEYLKILNNIITSRNETDLEENIKMLGISVDDFKSGKYIKPVIKKDFNDVKKRYKHKG